MFSFFNMEALKNLCVFSHLFDLGPNRLLHLAGAKITVEALLKVLNSRKKICICYSSDLSWNVETNL